MDNVQSPTTSVCPTLSSESFRSYTLVQSANKMELQKKYSLEITKELTTADDGEIIVGRSTYRQI